MKLMIEDDFCGRNGRVVSLIAGALGFTGVARGAASVSKVLFGLFLVIALVLFLLVILGVDLLTSNDLIFTAFA